MWAAIGYELVRRGRPVHFTSTAMLVQRLLRAKRDLVRELDRLDHFDAVVLDDIGFNGAFALIQSRRVRRSTSSPRSVFSIGS
jgi:DNA replication protein DnaC